MQIVPQDAQTAFLSSLARRTLAAGLCETLRLRHQRCQSAKFIV
jgi:hypothetical protein